MDAADSRRLLDCRTPRPTLGETPRREWRDAWRGKQPGQARRHHRQPFPWTTIYEFVPDDGEACLLSGDVLSLGVTRPRRREKALAKRGGPVFRAIGNGRRGVARLVPGRPPSLAVWDFLADDGVMRSDLAVEVFQSWGHSEAWNVWEARVRTDARKRRRAAAMRRGSRAMPSPVDSAEETQAQQGFFGQV
jgi:hypothetical protein